MKLKASLHIHTGADLTEGRAIGYSVFELIDEASRVGIDVLAHTCHEFFVWDETWADYALERNILLIPGVELKFKEGGSNNHVVVINCDDSISQVKTFADLKKYKSAHPDLLIIAAHPNFGPVDSLGQERLQKYWDLFDALENSWFYTKWFNLNKPIQKLAHEKNIPYIVTADLHHFNFKCLGTDYAILDLKEFTARAVSEAVKKGHFTNVTKPKSLWTAIKATLVILMMGPQLKLTSWREDVKNSRRESANKCEYRKQHSKKCE